jgi:hypothetical protein
MIQDSEYLETHLVAVPNQLTKQFIKSYESIAPMVVPRSAKEVAKDSEFTLYAVITFKKHGAEFVHKCREARWTPRDYKYKEGSKEEEAKEVDRLSQDERKLWGEALRLGRTGYSESAMVWIHVLVLRVFVETVLRYGLPLDFVCGVVSVSSPIPDAQSNIPANTHRQTPNWRRRLRPRSTRRLDTWAAMPLAVTRRAASSRTMRTCRASAMATSTARTFTTSSLSHRASLFLHVNQ